MTKKETMTKLLEYYDAFCLMTRTSTLLGTQQNEEWRRDTCYLADFIGKAYAVPQELIQAAEGFLLGEMSRLNTPGDYRALSSADTLGMDVEADRILYEIKGRALEEAYYADIPDFPSASGQLRQIRNEMGCSFIAHPYEPRMRYAQIRQAAQYGGTAAIMQLALMQILEIGCESSVSSAQRLLQSLLLWGDASAAKLLAFLWENEGDPDTAAYYSRIYEIMNRRPEVQAEVPETPENRFCILVAAVRSQIIQRGGRKEPDMLFAELLSRDDLSFSDKLGLIRTYRDGSWLNMLTEKKTHAGTGLLSSRNAGR